MRSVPPRGSGWVRRSLRWLDPRCHHAAATRDNAWVFLILIMWNDTDTPLAYFISFRTYGTWLHGDKRGSIDCIHNRYRSPYIPPNEKWRRYNEQRLRAKPLILKARQRKIDRSADSRDLPHSELVVTGNQRAHKSRPYCCVGKSQET